MKKQPGIQPNNLQQSIPEEEAEKSLESEQEKQKNVKESEQEKEVSQSEVKEEIISLEKENAQVMEDLNEAREDLPSIDEENELPRSVIENNEKIDKLKDDLDPEDNEEKAEKEKNIEEIRIGKVQLDRFTEKVQGLINVFKKRRSERLDEILDDGGISQLISGVTNIRDLISQEKYQQDDIDTELGKIANAISRIGEGPKPRGTRENPNALRALMTHLNNVDNQGHTLMQFLVKFPQDKTETTKKIVYTIEQRARDKKLFLAKKADALGKYRRR